MRSKAFIDGGSNKGQAFEYFKDIYSPEEYDYFLFEPNINCIQTLYDKTNGINGVTIHDEAIWVSNGEMVLNYNEDMGESSTLISDHNTLYFGYDKSMVVKTVDVVDIFTTLVGYSEIVVKLDIESSEYAVIDRLIETGYAKHIKTLYCEFHSVYMTTDVADKYIEKENYFRQYFKENGINFEDWH